MKKIVLIGASGYVGTALLNELLYRGYPVTAVVRHPENLIIKSPDLTVVQADVAEHDRITEICRGADAVISAYNPGWKNPDIYIDILRNYPVILGAVKKAGVKRFLVVGGTGSLFIAQGIRLVDSGQIPEWLLPGVRALNEFYLNVLSEEKELDWVYLSPSANMFPGERTGKFRIGKDRIIEDKNGESRISVEDFAVAMVDELAKPLHHKEGFTVGY